MSDWKFYNIIMLLWLVIAKLTDGWTQTVALVVACMSMVAWAGSYIIKRTWEDEDLDRKARVLKILMEEDDD